MSLFQFCLLLTLPLVLPFINEYSTFVVAIFTVVLALITGVYAYFTWLIVKKTDASLRQTDKIIRQNKDSHEQTERIIEDNRNEKKIAFLEKRLEKLYYPLQDYLNSEEMAMYREYWEFTSNPPNDDPSA
jgi:hypothetical protein